MNSNSIHQRGMVGSLIALILLGVRISPALGETPRQAEPPNEALKYADALSQAFEYAAQTIRPSVVAIHSVKHLQPQGRSDEPPSCESSAFTGQRRGRTREPAGAEIDRMVSRAWGLKIHLAPTSTAAAAGFTTARDIHLSVSDVRLQPIRQISDALPKPGTSAVHALITLAPPARSAIGLATANALANRPAPGPHQTDPAGSRHAGWWSAVNREGDLLDVLELRSEDDVGMVGCFSPLVEPIRRRVRRLFIFERGPRLSPGPLPEGRAAELLPRCSVALITATTLINGTIDALLSAAAGCREVVLLGPSTPLVPEVFAESGRRVTLLAGVVVTNAEELLCTVAADGGTRDFKASVAKVNVRVNTVNKYPP
jgi:uncharacterized protein (DUF4213/DUF364 family)